MLETLKFVRAAVDKSGTVPSMMHFRIAGGFIQANNGRLAIQCPVPTDLDCTPHAGQLLQAVAACEDVISMHLESGRLVVKSGRFKTFVHCCDNSAFRRFTPSGPLFPVPQEIVPPLKKLLPFVSTDERRPWACGVQISNNSAIATNSICIVEHWLPFAFPVIANIPRDAIAELVRLKVEPVAIQADAYAVTFHLPGNAWFACSVLKHEWPDTQTVFANAAKYSGPFVSGDGLERLLEAVAKLEGFTGPLGAVYFHKGSVSTVPEGETGTVVECPESPGAGVFRADQIAALRGVVDRVGFGNYPLPVPLFGGGLLRGVMSGFKS